VQIRTGSATTAEQFAALPLLHTSGVLTAATYTVPGALLQEGQTYSYTVTARDVAVGVPGCEVASLPASVTVASAVLPSAIRIVGYVYATTFAGHGLDGNTDGPWDGAFPVKNVNAYRQTEYWMDDLHSTAAATFSSSPDVVKSGSYWEMRLQGWLGGQHADLWHGRLYSSSPVGQYAKVSGAAPVSSVVTEGYTP
jgi:hypothetical protein